MSSFTVLFMDNSIYAPDSYLRYTLAAYTEANVEHKLAACRACAALSEEGLA
jgi:hypothetical protein